MLLPTFAQKHHRIITIIIINNSSIINMMIKMLMIIIVIIMVIAMMIIINLLAQSNWFIFIRPFMHSIDHLSIDCRFHKLCLSMKYSWKYYSCVFVIVFHMFLLYCIDDYLKFVKLIQANPESSSSHLHNSNWCIV